MRSSLSSSSYVLGASTIVLQRAFAKTNIDLSENEIIRNKQLSFKYSKSKASRKHHAFNSNNKTLWSDAARYALQRKDLPIVQRITIEEQHEKDALRDKADHAKAIAIAKGEEAAGGRGNASAAGIKRNLKISTGDAARRKKGPSSSPSPPTTREVGGAVPVEEKNPIKIEEEARKKSRRIIAAAAQRLDQSRAFLRAAVGDVVSAQQWVGGLKGREFKLAAGRVKIVKALLSVVRDEAGLTSAVQRSNTLMLQRAAQRRSAADKRATEEAIAKAASQGKESASEQKGDGSDAAVSDALLVQTPFEAPRGNAEGELHAATTRLLACVLLLEGLEGLLATVSPTLFASPIDAIVFLSSVAASSIRRCLALHEGTDLDAIAAETEQQAMTDASGKAKTNVDRAAIADSVDALLLRIERLMLQSSVFMCYLLTDPILTRGGVLLKDMLSQNAATDMSSNNRKTSAAHSIPQAEMEETLQLLNAINAESDQIVASLVSNICGVVREGIVGTNQDANGADGDAPQLASLPKLNARELSIVAKAVAVFADTTDVVDGNTFYSQFLSPLQQALQHEIRTITRRLEAQLNADKKMIDVFGRSDTVRNAAMPRQFDATFARLRHILEAGKALSTITEKHYCGPYEDNLPLIYPSLKRSPPGEDGADAAASSSASSSIALLSSAHSAVIAARHTEESILVMLTMVPNAFIVRENSAVLKWLSSVGMKGLLIAEGWEEAQIQQRKDGSTVTAAEKVLRKINANRSNYLLLASRSATISPLEGGTVTTVSNHARFTMDVNRVALLRRLAAIRTMALSAKRQQQGAHSGNPSVAAHASLAKAVVALSPDEHNWCAHSIRQLLKCIGNGDGLFGGSGNLPSSVGDGGDTVTTIISIIESAESIQYLPLELWTRMARETLKKNAGGIATTRSSTAADAEEEDGTMLAAKMLIDIANAEKTRTGGDADDLGGMGDGDDDTDGTTSPTASKSRPVVYGIDKASQLVIDLSKM